MEKTVVITGGNSGIGAFIAKAFIEEGYYVFTGSRKDRGLTKKLSSRLQFIKIDVRKESEHVKLAKAAVSYTGRLDCYINCAGFSRWSPIEKVNEKFWAAMIDTNLAGTFWGCKAAAKYLNKGGCIINISSLAGRRGSANNSVYCASKFGVTGITQSLAKELGPKSIRVNAVCPVYITTDGLMEALGEKASPAMGKNVKKYLKNFTASQASLGRLPKADEVAALCLFLASQKAEAITGQSMNVDCGVMPI